MLFGDDLSDDEVAARILGADRPASPLEESVEGEQDVDREPPTERPVLDEGH